MKKYYIYFFDKSSIVPCDDVEDCLNKVTVIRRDHPERKWILVQYNKDGEFEILTGSHDNKVKELNILMIGIYAFVIVAVIFLFLYLLGIF